MNIYELEDRSSNWLTRYLSNKKGDEKKNKKQKTKRGMNGLFYSLVKLIQIIFECMLNESD